MLQDSLLDIRIGRVSPCRSQTTGSEFFQCVMLMVSITLALFLYVHVLLQSLAGRKSFVEIRNSLHLLESLAASVKDSH